MPVENFTREQFESALPLDGQTGEPAWRCSGVIYGELTYCIGIGSPDVEIEVRSSLDRWGRSAPSGKNSIRVNLIRRGKPGNYAARKLQRWTTRLPHWEERLIDLIDRVAKLGAGTRSFVYRR